MIQPCHICDKNLSCFTSCISHMTQPYDPWAIIHAYIAMTHSYITSHISHMTHPRHVCAMTHWCITPHTSHFTHICAMSLYPYIYLITWHMTQPVHISYSTHSWTHHIYHNTSTFPHPSPPYRVCPGKKKFSKVSSSPNSIKSNVNRANLWEILPGMPSCLQAIPIQRTNCRQCWPTYIHESCHTHICVWEYPLLCTCRESSYTYEWMWIRKRHWITETHCNTLPTPQHTAKHCKTLQHIAGSCSTQIDFDTYLYMYISQDAHMNVPCYTYQSIRASHMNVSCHTCHAQRFVEYHTPRPGRVEREGGRERVSAHTMATHHFFAIAHVHNLLDRIFMRTLQHPLIRQARRTLTQLPQNYFIPHTQRHLVALGTHGHSTLARKFAIRARLCGRCCKFLFKHACMHSVKRHDESVPTPFFHMDSCVSPWWGHLQQCGGLKSSKPHILILLVKHFWRACIFGLHTFLSSVSV